MDLARISAAVLRRWWLLVLCAVVTGGVAFLVSSSLPKEYTSEAKVLVGSLTSSEYDQLLAYQQLAQTYAQVATTTPVLQSVATAIGLSDDPARLAERVSARAATGQTIVTIAATGPSPSDAAQLAGAVADGITRFAQAAGAESSLATVVQPALIPDGPSSPRVLLNSVVAAALGLALGVGLAALLTMRATPTIPSGSQISEFDPPAPARRRRESRSMAAPSDTGRSREMGRLD